MAVSLVEGSVAEVSGGPTHRQSPPRTREGATLGQPGRNTTDDEILGLGVRTRFRKQSAEQAAGIQGDQHPEAQDSIESTGDWSDAEEPADTNHDTATGNGDGERFREVFSANPELKQAWDEAKAYRESFSTPEEARSATKLLADFRAIDDLFFSARPDDHAELARRIAKLNPQSFTRLVTAINKVAASPQRADEASPGANGADTLPSRPQVRGAEEREASSKDAHEQPSLQQQFVQAANAEAVKGVVEAIETQVDRILPESVSKAARSRVVGEIYRELDAALRSNEQFAKQVRNAVRSGEFDGRHRSAVVSLVVGRARQALPNVAKQVLSEWTSTVLAKDRDRREKQRSSENRVDIGGVQGASSESRIRSPRDIDYRRMSDADILNL